METRGDSSKDQPARVEEEPGTVISIHVCGTLRRIVPLSMTIAALSAPFDFAFWYPSGRGGTKPSKYASRAGYVFGGGRGASAVAGGSMSIAEGDMLNCDERVW